MCYNVPALSRGREDFARRPGFQPGSPLSQKDNGAAHSRYFSSKQLESSAFGSRFFCQSLPNLHPARRYYALETLLFFLVALIAEVLGTIAGFGSSTIFLPLAVLFVDFRSALVLVAFFHIFGNLGRIFFFRHGFDKKLLIRFGLPSVILTLLGASLVNYLPQDLLKLILGIFLIFFAILSLLKPGFSFPPTRTSVLVGGSLSGFLAGLIGTGGALRGAFLTAFHLNKNIYIATAAGIALAVDLTRIPVYVAGGFLETGHYYYLPLLLVIAFSGSYLGKKLVDKVPQDLFRKLVLSAIILISVKFIHDGLLAFIVAAAAG